MTNVHRSRRQRTEGVRINKSNNKLQTRWDNLQTLIVKF